MASRPAVEGFPLLPMDRTLGQLFFPFALPYLAYVGLGALSPGLFSVQITGILRLLIVTALLWRFRKHYRFGPPLTLRQTTIALGAGLAATGIWIVALRFSLAMPFWSSQLLESHAAGGLTLPWVLRAINSTLLVPIFEELFCRAYLGEFFHFTRTGAEKFSSRLAQRWDDSPKPSSGPSFSRQSVIGSTLLFALGHDMSAWPAAVLYFLFTTWVYAKTRSFRVCILIHAIANLIIAGLVLARPEMGFLW